MNELTFLLHLVVAGGLLLAAGRFGQTGIVVMIVLSALLMNIAVSKQMTVFGLPVTGGNVEFATVFLANDILNEHFGPKAARRAILISFASNLVFVALMQFVLMYSPNSFDSAQSHLLALFNVTAYPRVVAASMISYGLSQLLDTQIYQAIRKRTGMNRLLWWRSNASTWISQAFDTVFFTTVGLTGPAAWGSVISTWKEWLGAVAFAYIIKILVAAIDTPFLYLSTLPRCEPVGSIRRTSAAPSPQDG